MLSTPICATLWPLFPPQAMRSTRKSPRAPAATAFRSTWSTGRSSRHSFFPPSLIAARCWSRSARAAPRRSWRGVCARRSKPYCPRALAELIGRHRRRFAAAPRVLSPRHFWQNVIAGPIAEAAIAGRSKEAEAQLVAAIDGNAARQSGADGKTETVFLVGAGPGDPDLLTLRALHVLADADVVFYDELVTAGVLDRARRGAERVFVGKRRGEEGVEQHEINRRLLAAARAGRRVVRLKGGDPFVFGRGGEELEYLRQAGVPVVVVPGITAALGCAAEVGLPLTFRNEAGKLAFITAQRAEDAAAIDWSGLADRQTTVVVYMGLASAASVRDGLIAAGRDGATPAAVLARGTRPDAQAAVGRLDGLAALATEVGEGPAILVIGEVVARSTPWRAAQADALIAREAA